VLLAGTSHATASARSRISMVSLAFYVAQNAAEVVPQLPHAERPHRAALAASHAAHLARVLR
jgi:hypothetical protein